MVEKYLIMRKSIAIFTVLLLFCVTAYAQNGKRTFVVGFYNLENLFDTYNDPAKNDEEFLPEGKNQWTETKYRKKLHNMATVIAAMAEDNHGFHSILGVSEIENRLVLEDLVYQPEIERANFQIVHYDGPDRRGVDVALLYRPEHFKFIESESIPFSFEGTSVNITLSERAQKYFRTRDILMVRGELGGEMFAFFVTHLPSRIGGKGSDLRSLGAEIIYKRSLKLMKDFPDIKIVVMGDMNDDPFDESMAKWMHGRKEISNVSKNDFYNPFWKMLSDGHGSLCYQGKWSIYDQILVNSNLVLPSAEGMKIATIGKKGQYYGRIFRKPWMTIQEGQYKGYPFRTFSNGSFINGYSDHYPTYIVISK